ncbi:MAG: EAL domain-containing protein [Nitriliruptoraceae bacterium]|nr:EAL domain-containing protein [Nitriliruptoraceae bacterium]
MTRQGLIDHSRVVAVAVGVALLILGITGWTAHRFEVTQDAAVEELFTNSTERAAYTVATSTVNLQVLLQAVVSLHDTESDVGVADLRELIARASANSGHGNSLPGVDQLVIVAERGVVPVIETTRTIGTSRDIEGTAITVGSPIRSAMERSDDNGLPTWEDAEQLAGADVALIQSMRPASDGSRRWAVILVDRELMIERAIRGSELAVEVSDTTASDRPMENFGLRDVESRAPVDTDRTSTQRITAADRTLQLDFYPTTGFEAQLPTTPTPLVWSAGGLTAALAALVVAMLLTGRVRAEGQAQRSHAALASEQRRFRSLAASSPVGIAYTDPQGTVGYANHRLAAILEPGTDPSDAEVAGHPLSRYLAAEQAAQLESMLANPDGPSERAMRATLHDGRILQLRLARIDAEGQADGWAVTVEDITEQVHHQDELRREESRHRELATRFAHRAAHDALTELPNRSHLVDELGRRLATADTRLGVVFADLDGFKVVNDSLGHHAGDDLLRLVAERVRRVVRPGDLPARLGGDEFAILVDQVTDPSALEQVATRLVEALDRPFEVLGRRVSISVSLGLRLARSGDDTSEVLRDADLAMYAAKRDVARHWCWFAPAMHDAVQARHDLDSALRDALRWGGFKAAYQPIVDLRTGRTVHVETLARFEHPRLGRVSPDRFIPVLEETGLIGRLGRTMLRTATVDAATWPDPEVGLTVNVSAAEVVAPRAAERLEEIVRASGFDPGRLVLELTESDVASDDPRIVGALHEIRQRGVRVAIDDFGTGRSSLAKLRTLPVDILKIDRAFVDGIDHSPRDRAFLAGVVALSRTLGLTTVAEGIETDAQLQTLRGLGCHLGQGYHLGRPAGTDAVAGWLVRPVLPPARGSTDDADAAGASAVDVPAAATSG